MKVADKGKSPQKPVSLEVAHKFNELIKKPETRESNKIATSTQVDDQIQGKVYLASNQG